jgi:hypothetical protein
MCSPGPHPNVHESTSATTDIRNALAGHISRRQERAEDIVKEFDRTIIALIVAVRELLLAEIGYRAFL